VNAIGQRIAPSQGDLDAVAQLYAADLSIVARLFPSESGVEAEFHVANNLMQGAHEIEVTTSLRADLVRAHSDNGWNCTFDSGNDVICRLKRLPGGATSVLRLDVVNNPDLLEVLAQVRSKTPDIDSSNNVNSSDNKVPESQNLVAVAAVQAQPLDDDESPAFVGSMSYLCLFALLLLPRQTRLRHCERELKNTPL